VAYVDGIGLLERVFFFLSSLFWEFGGCFGGIFLICSPPVAFSHECFYYHYGALLEIQWVRNCTYNNSEGGIEFSPFLPLPVAFFLS